MRIIFGLYLKKHRMKLRSIFLLTFFSFSILLSAQSSSDDSRTFHKGIRAGWQYANMYRSGNTDFNNLNAFYVGIFSEGKVAPLLRVGSSLEYFQNGFNADNETFKMHTISLPFYLKLKLGPLFGTAGFAANFKVADNREDFPGGEQTTDKITDTKFFDLPLSVGVGAKFLFLQIEAKYNWGLFQAATINGYGYKNQYLQLGMSVIL